MTTRAHCAPQAQASPVGGASWMTLLLATACGLIVANLYYAQPLIGPIGHALGLSPQAAGLIVTLIQAGYGAGLLLIVPLGDIIENRRLICSLLAASALALAGAALAGHAGVFLLAAVCIGLSSVAAQVLVPFAAHLAPEHARGRVVGNVMSGLMLGIMLARPAASLVTDLWGWHAIFAGSAVGMALLALVLMRLLPDRRPAPRCAMARCWCPCGSCCARSPYCAGVRPTRHACLGRSACSGPPCPCGSPAPSSA